jgi:predicted GIY-YIG superfamily endonuclease
MDQLVRVEAPKEEKVNDPDLASKSMRWRSAKSVPLELNLIGQHVDEAELNLDKYLDECRLKGFKRVRIIHGWGSGAFSAKSSAIIARIIKTSSLPMKGPMGPRAAGGATIVHLKYYGTQRETQRQIALLPDKPGVYQMKDADDKIIYIGKAKNLKKRVSQYFLRPQTGKVFAMVSHVDHFDFIIVHTDQEAFILEMNLIQTYYPRYNIMLMDDSHYPYIAVKRDDAYLKIARRAPINAISISVLSPIPPMPIKRSMSSIRPLSDKEMPNIPAKALSLLPPWPVPWTLHQHDPRRNTNPFMTISKASSMGGRRKRWTTCSKRRCCKRARKNATRTPRPTKR